jgi:hypothetical protein
MKCHKTFILFLGFLLVNGNAAANGIEFLNDKAELGFALPDGEQVLVGIKTIRYTPMIPFKKGFRWGTVSNMPKKLIGELNVKVGVEEVYIPFSAYCDLTNPRKLSARVKGEEFVLTIMGGDAAGSYTAELFFNEKVIKRKKVCHNEFPDVAWEETIYSFNY